MARLMLEASASVNMAAGEADPPLHIACRRLEPALIELLLQFSPEVNQRNVDGCSPLDVLLLQSKMEAKLAGTRLLAAHGADVNSASPGGFTALYWAADSLELTQQLLQLGARPDPDAAEIVPSPLHEACRLGLHRVARLLLDAGAAVNGVYDSGGRVTPLGIAVRFESVRVEDACQLSIIALD
jgi:ankyrin repeat protein